MRWILKRLERCRKRKSANERGQATVEFALTMMLLLAFVFFYIQLALIFAWGNYVHYSTFMAARAFLSGGSNQEDQRTRAREVIVRTLKRGPQKSGEDRIPTIAKGIGGNDPAGFETVMTEGDRTLSWQNGVRYTFKSKLFLLPLAGGLTETRGRGAGDVNSLTLTAESLLGREPTHEECQKEMGKFPGIWDNGC